MKISFRYRVLSGELRDYTIEFLKRNDTHIYGYHDGSFKSFRISQIENADQVLQLIPGVSSKLKPKKLGTQELYNELVKISQVTRLIESFTTEDTRFVSTHSQGIYWYRPTGLVILYPRFYNKYASFRDRLLPEFFEWAEAQCKKILEKLKQEEQEFQFAFNYLDKVFMLNRLSNI